MARTTCKDCGNPREPESTYYSYCIGCGRTRQRNRYARVRQEAGHEVTSRVDSNANEERRRTKLLEGDGKPGQCEVCHMYALSLNLVNTGDPSSLADVYGEPDGNAKMLGIWCERCRLLSKLIDDDVMQQAVHMHNYLRRQDPPLTLSAILPDLNDVMHNKVPKPLSLTPLLTPTIATPPTPSTAATTNVVDKKAP